VRGDSKSTAFSIKYSRAGSRSLIQKMKRDHSLGDLKLNLRLYAVKKTFLWGASFLNCARNSCYTVITDLDTSKRNTHRRPSPVATPSWKLVPRPRSKHEKRTAGSAWDSWTVSAADSVCCACVGWEINSYYKYIYDISLHLLSQHYVYFNILHPLSSPHVSAPRAETKTRGNNNFIIIL
jgi:hypothetical protein